MTEQPQSDTNLAKPKSEIKARTDEELMQQIQVRTKSQSLIYKREKQDKPPSQKSQKSLKMQKTIQKQPASRQQLIPPSIISQNTSQSKQQVISPIVIIVSVICGLCVLVVISRLSNTIKNLQHSFHNITNQLSTQINSIHHTLSQHQQLYGLLSEQIKVSHTLFSNQISKQETSLQYRFKIINGMILQQKDTIKLGSNSTDSSRLTLKNVKMLSEITNSQLQHLHLYNNKLGDQSFEIITKAPWFQQLKSIELSGNQLTDKFVVKLVQKKNYNLQWLNIENNNITDKGMQILISNANMLPSLKYINYNHNKIIDKYKVHYKFRQILPKVKFAEEQDNI